jgi:hypothetical protein
MAIPSPELLSDSDLPDFDGFERTGDAGLPSQKSLC